MMKLLQKYRNLPLYIRILPAISISIVLFLFSNTPGSDAKDVATVTIPFLGTKLLDLGIKKGAHLITYMALSQSYFHVFSKGSIKNRDLAMVLTTIFAVSDEIHQIFTPARNARFVDILIDVFGGWVALYLIPTFIRSFNKRKK